MEGICLQLRIINLEIDMATVAVARSRLLQQLQFSKMHGEKALKIIHGYGSTGKGGAIKLDVQRVLEQKRRSNAIKGYVKGEDFSPFCEECRRLTSILPELKRDRDYAQGNDGITIVVL